MHWTEEHDKLLCREALTVDPFTGTKKGTQARGSKWKEIVNYLTNIENPTFKVDVRAVRDRYQLLAGRLRKKLSDEKRASGIETDMTETEKALEELIEKEDAATESQDTESDAKRKQKDEDRSNAENMRKQAMERMSQTTKRKKEEGDEVPTKRRRSNGTDTMMYLRERNELNAETKKDELAIRNKELALQEKRHTDMMQLMLQQQQQNTQKDQEFKMLMMTMLEKLSNK